MIYLLIALIIFAIFALSKLNRIERSVQRPPTSSPRSYNCVRCGCWIFAGEGCQSPGCRTEEERLRQARLQAERDATREKRELVFVLAMLCGPFLVGAVFGTRVALYTFLAGIFLAWLATGPLR